MSEYWKSTERYWCKHCKLFVKDTKIERQNHDATPRHQGNLKRFVRDLHKNNDREEREKQRAKDEVSRLNGVVSGAPGPSKTNSSSIYATGPAGPLLSTKLQVGVSRKDQLQQLVDLGVAIPDEFRKELSMTGDWKTVSERIVDPGSDAKAIDAIGFGVRKRDTREDADDEDEVQETKKRRWESSHKTHHMGMDDDLDMLLSQDFTKTKTVIKDEQKQEVIAAKHLDPLKALSESIPGNPALDTTVKAESVNELSQIPLAPGDSETNSGAIIAVEGVVFKKRAKKNIRQK